MNHTKTQQKDRQRKSNFWTIRPKDESGEAVTKPGNFWVNCFMFPPISAFYVAGTMILCLLYMLKADRWQLIDELIERRKFHIMIACIVSIFTWNYLPQNSLLNDGNFLVASITVATVSEAENRIQHLMIGYKHHQEQEN